MTGYNLDSITLSSKHVKLRKLKIIVVKSFGGGMNFFIISTTHNRLDDRISTVFGVAFTM